MNPIGLLVMVLWLMPAAVFAEGVDHGSETPYAGYENRSIKSLSEDDIDELRRGGGWGLALPAELNGRPGPAHLLDLKEELSLTPEQVAEISKTYEAMRAEAIPAGERLISAEAALSDAFAEDDLDLATLKNLLAEASDARESLQFIHLSRHLETPALLSEAQIQRYDILRGYAEDPCQNVPEGHDASAWRRHNGCG